MNLVETIMQSLGGDTLGKLSGVLGAEKDETKSAVSAAVPALLAGIGSLTSKPAGAEKLWSAVQGVDDSVVGNLNDLLSGEKPDVVSNMGSGILESLFGKGILATLIGVLGSYLGGKSNLISKLLPLLAPVVLSTLSKQVKSGGLDLGGLTKMILGQKGNIASAMPAGLGQALSGAQGLGDFSGFTQGVSGAMDAAGRTASSAARETANAASPAKWLLPLIAILAIGGLLWSFMGRTKDVVNDATRAIEDVAGDVTTNAGTLTTGFTDLFANMNDVIGNVTDAESARAALPKLQDMNTQLGSLSTTFEKLPESSRPALESMIRDSVAQLDEKKEAVLAIPGVGDILRSVLDAIFEKLSNLLGG